MVTVTASRKQHRSKQGDEENHCKRFNERQRRNVSSVCLRKVHWERGNVLRFGRLFKPEDVSPAPPEIRQGRAGSRTQGRASRLSRTICASFCALKGLLMKLTPSSKVK